MIRIACATNNGKDFIKEHFGNAKKYMIFEFDENKYYSMKKDYFKLYKIIDNIPFEEKKEGDPEKANVISSLLKPLDVKVLINKAMGPNITKMRKQFVCIISNINDIEIALKKLDIKNVLKEIKRKKEENKTILYIK